MPGLRRALRRLRTWAGHRRSGTEIDRVKAALRRHHERYMRDYPMSVGDCCPGCRYGSDPAHGDLLDKIERVKVWLQVLLRRRGRPEDLDLAAAIAIDCWP